VKIKIDEERIRIDKNKMKIDKETKNGMKRIGKDRKMYERILIRIWKDK
jgi:hypothetical protein